MPWSNMYATNMIIVWKMFIIIVTHVLEQRCPRLGILGLKAWLTQELIRSMLSIRLRTFLKNDDQVEDVSGEPLNCNP